ncbi:MAG: ATP-dependent zinc metalloprotease FtsH [Faecousia sp.]
MKRKNFAVTLVYIVILISLFSWIFKTVKNLVDPPLSYAQVVTLFEKEQVKSFVVRDGTVYLELNWPLGGKTEVEGNATAEALRQDLGDLFRTQLEKGVLEDYTFMPDSEPSVFVKAIPYFLAGVLLLLIWAMMSSQNNGNNLAGFTRAKASLGSSDDVTFRDVAGVDEELEELQEVVDFLRQPERFREMGAKVPKGVLLVGPPGTGKTLLARAVAGEAGVQFLSISGSDFLELYVGVGASRVRDLFEQAKRLAPAIVFIDEIDAVGRRRGAGVGGGHDEREQTLNQLLVEMDGFQKTEGVIVLAATNRQDILDPALLRPGRFDRQIYVGLPDSKGREDILKIHARNKRLDAQVSLKQIALATGGFTGADLKNLLNEAAILAVREKHPVITAGDIDEAMMKVIAGPRKKSHRQLQRDLRITAIHEAGHAVAIYHLPTHDPVHQISIIPRGRTLGVTVYLPEEDSDHQTRNEMYEQIVSLLGGRVAEELFCQDISTGASNDLQRATKLAWSMVAKYGMSQSIGAVVYDDEEEIFVGNSYERTRSYSQQTAGALDGEVKRLIDKAYDHCRQLLRDNEAKLMQITDFLLKHETMGRKQFLACMEGREIDPDDTEGLIPTDAN